MSTSETNVLDDLRESEIAALSARYGAPRRVAVELRGGPFRPISATDRIGEVCMVVRRTNGKLLTAVKTFYPPGAFRLLTGGVSHGERIEAALLRETAEETGLAVAVRRFLAVIEYRPVGDGGWGMGRHGDTETRRHGDTETGNRERSIAALQSPTPDPRPLTPDPFVTFAFLLDEVGGVLSVQDESEQIGEFREVAIADLPAIARTLECVPDVFHPEIVGSWSDWGRFRAIVHRVVYEALQEDQL